MNFRKHYNLEGLHAPFSASKAYWLGYSEDEIIDYYHSLRAKEIGTELHAYAEQAIKLGIKQANSKKTLNRYINDAIGFDMEPEVVLFYSDNFFGTADSISFTKNFLRIHDLKTGKSPVHMRQLYVYAALFCLEYNVKPVDISMELRIYQNDEVEIDHPTGEDIQDVMDKIVNFDKVISSIKE